MPFLLHPGDLSLPARRIVSLVPSQTELLYDLGLEAETIGITKFCIHPAIWFRSKTRVGGTKNIDPARIRALQPDLVLANQEENVREQVAELAAEFPVWVSNVQDLSGALEMIRAVGILTGKATKAEAIMDEISASFRMLENSMPPGNQQNCCYLIWKNPWMTVGKDTFIHDMLSRAGISNAFGDRTRYPAISLEDISDRRCGTVFLSSEPYPFRDKDVRALADALPGVTVRLVDGEMFSWYGSRLRKTAEYLYALRRE